MLPNTKIAIAVSQFNWAITEKLLQGAYDQLRSNNINENNITIVQVPGAVELPLTAKWLAKTNNYAAIICLGAVIRGETNHYDYVCQQVSSGCMQVMLEFEIPIIFGVLTTENELQAQERAGGKEGNKGIDCADAALKMMSVVHSQCSC